jgi:carboxyl-terminal processing protease
MLHAVATDLRKNYYDASFHGVDLDKLEEEKKREIQSSKYMNEALTHVAGFFSKLNDSHTFFVPPIRPYTHDYDWRMLMIGDRCYVTAVKPKSDAERKGLRPGDEVLAVNNVGPTRKIFVEYEQYLTLLSPKPVLKLRVARPGASPIEMEVEAEMHPQKRIFGMEAINDIRRAEENEAELRRSRVQEINKDVLIWKLPEFFQTDQALGFVEGKASKHKTVIFDLRGNPGGFTEILRSLVAYFFDHDVKVCDQVKRKETKEMIVKTSGRHAFTGNLIVLVDNGSASAAEIFARLIQLEKRGTVVGDVTSGRAMESYRYGHTSGTVFATFYGVSITIADLKMSDGESLEHVGVRPDELIMPTAADLAAGRDPVLSRAAALAGAVLSPEVAGKLFPVEWR